MSGPPVSRRSSRSLLAACCLAMATTMLPASAPAMLAGAVSCELDLDLTHTGVFLSAAVWGFFAAILLTGPAADRVGFRPLFPLAAACQVLGWVLTSASGSFGMLLAAQATAGFGTGMCDSLLTPLACAAYPDRRTRASNLLHSFYAIGLGGGVALVLISSRLGASWRTTAALMAMPPLIYAATMLALPLPRRTHAGAARLTSRRLLVRGDFLRLIGAMILAGATEYGPMTWLPSFVGLQGPSVGLQAGLGMGLFAACMLAGRLGTLALSDRLGGPVRVVLAGAGVCMGCLLVAALPIGGSGRIVAIAGVGLAVAAMWPTLLALAGDRFPQAGASMFAILAAGGATGCAVAPAAIGVIGERSSLAVAIATTAICPLGVVWLVSGLGESPREAGSATVDSPRDPTLEE